MSAHLVSKDANGAGWRHKFRGKPSGCQLSRDAQDKDLSHSNHGLSAEEKHELVGAGGKEFHPAAQAGAKSAQEDGSTQTLELDIHLSIPNPLVSFFTLELKTCHITFLPYPFLIYPSH